MDAWEEKSLACPAWPEGRKVEKEREGVKEDWL